MGVSYKYLVTCIVSIFLALGIGILIGLTIDSTDIISKQQSKILTQAEDQINSINDKNIELQQSKNELNSKLQNYGKYITIANKYLLKDKLKGLNVSVIATSGDYTYYNYLKSLEKAGAKIETYIAINSDLLNSDNDIKDKIKEYLQGKDLLFTDDPYNDFFVQLANAVSDGNNSDILDFGKQIGLIQIIANGQKPCDVVIMGGGSSKDESMEKTVDNPIINQLKDKSVNMVGVEGTNVNKSYVSLYKDKGISTIDNVDTQIGLVSLCMVLQGKYGNYGVKSTASELMPDSFIENYKVVNRKVQVNSSQAVNNQVTNKK